MITKIDERKLLLFMYEYPGRRPFPYNVPDIHPNRLWYILCKWSDKNIADYGVSPYGSWLTPKGKALAKEMAHEH